MIAIADCDEGGEAEVKEVLADIDRWTAAGRRVAVARVVGLEGSGPRDPGATMAVSDQGEVAGSVSGGCVEGAVVAVALEILGGLGQPRLVTFGYSDDEAFAVGLTCGGTVHVFIEPLDRWRGSREVVAGELYHELQDAIRAADPVVLATVVVGPPEQLGATVLVRPGARPTDPPTVIGSLGQGDLDRVVERDALGELQVGRTATRHYGPGGQARGTELSVFMESFASPPRMIIFGAVDFTAALGRAAKLLGYRVTVCDPRPVFATAARFPMADEIVVDRPNRYLEKIGPELGPRDAACVLTHDAKLDVPAIVAALATAVGYLGVMGNRRTHADRVARLREAGVDDAGVARLMAPIGLDIGSRTPEETAVSICAEIIALRTGHEVPSLRDRHGPVHVAPSG